VKIFEDCQIQLVVQQSIICVVSLMLCHFHYVHEWLNYIYVIVISGIQMIRCHSWYQLVKVVIVNGY
jgi:hypothetical protein